MTSGVYQLKFSNGQKYIGKSCDIARRWDEHAKRMLDGKASVRMQRAYDECGLPSAIVLAECHRDHIDLLESVYITALKPELNSENPDLVASDELELLFNRVDLLKFSTGQHIKMIEDLASRNVTLEDRVAYLEDTNSQSTHIRLLESQLKKYKEQTWWEKLFG